MNEPQSEIGRELNAGELQAKTVVVMKRADRLQTAITIWVDKIEPDWIVFQANGGRVPMTLLAKRDGEHLFDDTGLRLHVFEFLGDYDGKIRVDVQ